MDSKKYPASKGKSPSNSPHQPSKKLKQDIEHEQSSVPDGAGDEMGLASVDNAAAKRSLAFGQTDVEDDSPPRWFLRFFKEFELRLESKIVKRLDDLTLKVTEHDDTLTACTIHLDSMEREIQMLKKEREEMASKLDDLENRSRRNNLVYHGIPEVPKEICENTINEMLVEFVGLSPTSYQIERCHRTPSSPTPATEKEKRSPRIIHVAFATFAAKEKVRKACVQKFKMDPYKGSKIFVSDDFSKRVLMRRKSKMDKFKQLKDEGKKPFFLYPDRLGFRGRDGKLHLVA